MPTAIFGLWLATSASLDNAEVFHIKKLHRHGQHTTGDEEGELVTAPVVPKSYPEPAKPVTEDCVKAAESCS
ncbi:MAG: hypothetical protein WA117_07460 [Verrucomicrobiia bacterium]